MSYCFILKHGGIIKHTIIFVLLISFLSEVVQAAMLTASNVKPTVTAQTNQIKPLNPGKIGRRDNIQIGNSYFRQVNPKGKEGPGQRTINQVGAAVEEHQQYTIFYGFVNQLFTNHIYYELRAYALYRYITQNPPAPPLVPEIMSDSSLHNSIGYGGVGILGYNMAVNSNVSFLPFVRLQAITNTTVAYADSFGNRIDSVNYAAFLGAKLSMRVTDIFAIYTQYYAGYQTSIVSGQGIYSIPGNPKINALVSILEFGTPYRISKSLSLTPYIQLITAGANPNGAALRSPYSISPLTNTRSVYAIKLGYNF